MSSEVCGRDVYRKGTPCAFILCSPHLWSQRRLRLRLDAVHADIHLRVLELSRPHVRNALLDDLVQVARQQMLLRLTVLRDTFM